jgi:DNA-binding MarR family transcriptional regulator
VPRKESARPAVRWLDEREARAWRGLQLMDMQLTAALAHQLAVDSGLSYPDYVVLVALTGQPEGRLRVFELARVLGWEKSRVSHHVARMSDRGLVEKQRCGDDRRGSFVAVTDKGRAEIEAAAPGHVRTVRELFVDRLTPAQLDVLGDVAETVLARLTAECDAAEGDLEP